MSKVFTCDNCGATASASNVSRPKGWTSLAISGYIRDRQSIRVERDFCKQCMEKKFPEESSKLGYAEELEGILIEFINETVQEALDNAQC